MNGLFSKKELLQLVLNHGSRTLGEKFCPENVQGHRMSAACFSQEKDLQDVNITQLVLSIFLTLIDRPLG